MFLLLFIKNFSAFCAYGFTFQNLNLYLVPFVLLILQIQILSFFYLRFFYLNLCALDFKRSPVCFNLDCDLTFFHHGTSHGIYLFFMFLITPVYFVESLWDNTWKTGKLYTQFSLHISLACLSCPDKCYVKSLNIWTYPDIYYWYVK